MGYSTEKRSFGSETVRERGFFVASIIKRIVFGWEDILRLVFFA